MPHLYVTGTDAEGRSTVVERRELVADGSYHEALRFGAEPAVIPEGGKFALLDSPAEPGGAVYNIYTWLPGQRSGMHRTTTTDFDVVLQGSVLMELETETVTLEAGDCAILPGVAHSWSSGPDGAIVMYNLVVGRPSGADVDRPRGFFL